MIHYYIYIQCHTYTYSTYVCTVHTHVGMYIYDIVCIAMLLNQLYIYILSKYGPQPLLVKILKVWICCPACPQATTYKGDFEKERSDREKAMGRFETERQEFNMCIAEINEKVKAMYCVCVCVVCVCVCVACVCVCVVCVSVCVCCVCVLCVCACVCVCHSKVAVPF